MKNEVDILSVKQRAMKGMAILTLREVLMKGIAFIGQLLLVRLLLPEYFGVFTIISFIINVADIITDLGLTMALIQKKDTPTKKQIATVYYFKLLLSLSVFLLLIFLSRYLPLFYQQLTAQHIVMLQVCLLILLIKPLRTTHVALLERDLQYKKVSSIDLFGMVFYYLSAILFAYLHFGVWSFIIALIIKELIEALVALYYVRWFPDFAFSLSSIKAMTKIGVYFQTGSIFSFIHQSTIPVIAGIKTSTRDVGLLDWSANVASIPRSLSENVGRVSFSSFSRIQEDKFLIAKTIEKSFNYLTVISFFFILVTLGFGHDIVKYILTDKWLPAVPALYWYIGGTFFLNGTASLGHGILAMGKSKALFLLSLFIIPGEWLLSYLLLLKYGYVGIAMGSFFGLAAMFFSYLILCQKYGIYLHVYSLLVSKFYIFLLLLFLTLGLNNVFGHSALDLFLKLFLFSISFCTFYFFYMRKDVPEIISLLKMTIR